MVLISAYLLVCTSCLVATTEPATPDPARLERSYWLHASLGLKPYRGYWGETLPASAPPTEQEVANAVRLLAGDYAANRLYLLYHREITLQDAKHVFGWWRKHCPGGVELVPAVVLRMYDKSAGLTFAPGELRELCSFFKGEIRAERLAVFDVYPDRDQGPGLGVLAERFSGRLVRLGIQPDEKLASSFSAAVQDTWSGLCHGKTHVDWLSPGFGAETFRKWVEARNAVRWPTAWDLIVVAWDYSTTARGEYPGYDDANRNMPLPAGRNTLAVGEVFRIARPANLAGFSSDLTILQANSVPQAHDGVRNSFYESLKRGEVYRGYYRESFAEVAAIFRGLREGKRIEPPTPMPAASQAAR